ncbi:MAG: 16S rRNA (guanine(527)-N(7))-methyltransferase RsmG [Desulfitobacteriaceae bacterium]|nr:16S rRNA (guanine(527)-N(7))-methyltransferase RsmG [Desulfitobacteriaceae bacterium]MDD4345348.1 16S rRNA (guanine(527)-N(7))-methyltransferase RsmG [Desulfitobacteriaceae bacterium]MDD4400329.1 16S rRNA (guanine(527)-N(7))-methyltransferase RsmG [Desulfitobacteriaceae bacterium]
MFDQWAREIKKLVMKNNGIILSDQQLAQFCLYGDLLLEWNKKMNLTRIVDPQEMILKHFLDSLSINQYLDGCIIADIGTGAGFPGIPLKIVRQDLKLYLVDSLKKRIEFLREVILRLGLKEVEIIHVRAEEMGRNRLYRAGFDIVTSRAVARLPVLLEYTIPLLKEKGIFIAMKGSQTEDELAEAKSALVKLGAEVVKVAKFSLGVKAEHRSIIIIRKTTVTPDEYPRKPGIPSKYPLI